MCSITNRRGARSPQFFHKAVKLIGVCFVVNALRYPEIARLVLEHRACDALTRTARVMEFFTTRVAVQMSTSLLLRAHQAQVRKANVKSKAPLAPIICQWSFDVTFAKEQAAKGCEC